MASALHKELYLIQMGSLVRIQPLENGSPSGPSLAIDLRSCTVGAMESSVPLSQERNAQRIYGIIGLQQLAGGAAIAVITGAKQALFYSTLISQLLRYPVFLFGSLART